MNKDQIIEHIHAFFQKTHIQHVISTIRECDVSGWEGWLQVEFAHYLQETVYKKQKMPFSWYREFKIITGVEGHDDNDSSNHYIIPDFWISSDVDNDKGFESEFYLIEFKRSNKGDIRELMEGDIKKWQCYLKGSANPSILKCRNGNNTENSYINKGVIFVGVDTKLDSSLIQESFDGLTTHSMRNQFFYRIDSLDVS